MAANNGESTERLKAKLRLQLAELLDGEPAGRLDEARRARLTGELQQAARMLGDENRALRLAPDEEQRLIKELLVESVGFGPLEPLLGDPTISEIMVNGPHEVFVERNGKLQRADVVFQDANHLMAVIERMLGTVNLSVSEANPLCDASLDDGNRINVIIPPLTLNGPVVTIRRKSREWTMEDFIGAGALTREAAQFLQACVRSKVNLIVSGGTSTGKTTVVSILTQAIPEDERIVTIENVAELELPGRRHWIRLVGKAPNLEGKGEIPLRVLVKNALRMRPDRIILGEARGGEALDVVQAMHSGHDGFITVLHANTARSALERMETLMLMSGLDLPPAACRTQIASAVDVVVHMGRYADGTRRVASITQVLGSTKDGYEIEDLFTFEAQGFSADGKLQGAQRYTGARPKALEKFRLNNVEVPAWITT